jgi:hypothetical protein
VADVTVNEGSPFILFTLESFVGQRIKVWVSEETADLGNVSASGSDADASSSLQYFDGSNWVNYTPGQFIDVVPGPDAMPGDPASILVRMAVRQDDPYELSESRRRRRAASTTPPPARFWTMARARSSVRTTPTANRMPLARTGSPAISSRTTTARSIRHSSTICASMRVRPGRCSRSVVCQRPRLR